jgi:hypothetical protein
VSLLLSAPSPERQTQVSKKKETEKGNFYYLSKQVTKWQPPWEKATGNNLMSKFGG